MNGRNPLTDLQFVEEELFSTQQALFSARTVREIKFLQTKINYLKTVAKEIKKR